MDVSEARMTLLSSPLFVSLRSQSRFVAGFDTAGEGNVNAVGGGQGRQWHLAKCNFGLNFRQYCNTDVSMHAKHYSIANVTDMG